MTFATMRTELAARGFDYLSSARLGAYINAGYHELNDTEFWPFRRVADIGTANAGFVNLTFANGTNTTISRVFENNNDVVLTHQTQLDLEVEFGSDLSTPGVPSFYYLAGDVVYAYPRGGTIQAWYYKVPADLSADGDATIIPTRFERLIVDLAVERAYREQGGLESFQVAAMLRVAIDRDLDVMRRAMFTETMDGPDSIVHASGAVDG